jgi:hypothetical protein
MDRQRFSMDAGNVSARAIQLRLGATDADQAAFKTDLVVMEPRPELCAKVDEIGPALIISRRAKRRC